MAKRSRSPKLIDVSAIEGAGVAPFPGFVPFCHPTLRTGLPEGDWLYEAKLDGYRAQLHRHDGKTLGHTRNGLDWSDAFTLLCAAPEDSSEDSTFGTYLHAKASPIGAPCLHLKSRMPQSEYTMNLFYIIGVVVVIVVVAGFLGVRV
jgi:hypothetical protein